MQYKFSIPFLFTALLFFATPGLEAQVAYSRSFEIDENNSVLTANILFKDYNGFLWIGTNNGLYRFNGLRMQAISFPGNVLPDITALGETKDGTIWAGCKDGRIGFLKNSIAQWFLPEEGLPKVSITAFCSDMHNRIWFGTAGEGIYYQDGKHLYNINLKDGLSDNFINVLVMDSSGGMVAGTDRGLAFIAADKETKKVIPFTTQQGLPDNIVRSLTPSDVEGYWWVGMQDKGICMLDINKKQLINNFITPMWNYGQVNDVIDFGKEVWIATEEKGLLVYNKKAHYIEKQLLNDSLTGSKINDLQFDNEGNVWFVNNNKLFKTHGNQWLHFKNLAPLVFDEINALLAVNDGSLWVASGKKLYRCQLHQQEKKITEYPLKNLPENNIITSLYIDKYGGLWIGTMGKGLLWLNTQTGNQQVITENPLLVNGHILSITGDSSSIWVASLNGVAQLVITGASIKTYGKITWKNYRKQDGIGSDYVYHLFNDSKQRLWLGTDGGGVAIYEKGLFRNLLQQQQLTASVVYSIAEDYKGNIWFNTLNEGIVKYDGKQFVKLSALQALTNTGINAMMPTLAKELLLVNKKGVDIYHTENNTVSHLGRERNLELQQLALNAICQDGAGYTWLGQDNGLVRYSPSLHKQQVLPLVLIDKVEINSKVTDTTTAHKYAYYQNTFRFLLVQLYFTEPEKVKFQYQLTGYTNKWETTSDPTIFFSHLNSGNYVFRVRASANGNFDNAIESTYSFSIVKPFWQHWWFRIVGMAIFAALLYVIMRQRVKKIKREEQIKNERFRLEYNVLKSQVNPHFLFNSFNALLNVVEENTSEAAAFIKQLSSFYRKMTAYSDKDLITLKEELEMMKTYLFIQKKRYGNALEVTISVPEIIQNNCVIPPLALQLLAENAVKHNAISIETPLHIKVWAEDDFLLIQNNINPKFKKEAGEGLGLQNISMRFKMFTTKEMKQENNNGFFTLQVPLINKP